MQTCKCSWVTNNQSLNNSLIHQLDYIFILTLVKSCSILTNYIVFNTGRSVTKYNNIWKYTAEVNLTIVTHLKDFISDTLI